MFNLLAASSNLKLPRILYEKASLISSNEGTTLEYSPKWYIKSNVNPFKKRNLLLAEQVARFI